MRPLKVLGGSVRWLIAEMLYRPRARKALRGCELADDVDVQGDVKVIGAGGVRVGAGVMFRRGVAPQELRCGAGAELIIGARSVLNYGVLIRAEQSVRVGAHCLLGSFVRLDDAAAEFDTSGPIVVEDDVWMAHGVVIAPGVRIGRGSVVAAGSRVLSDVPADTLAIGNPARCIPLDCVASRAKASNGTERGGGGAESDQAKPMMRRSVDAENSILT